MIPNIHFIRKTMCMCLRSLMLVLHVSSAMAVAAKKTYIVQMKPDLIKPTSFDTNADWYDDLFHSLVTSDEHQYSSAIIHTYQVAYNGFAATMSVDQVDSLLRSDSVLAVHEDRVYQLHTTRTPQFLGLNDQDLWYDHGLDQLNKASEDVIIGVLDTGVVLESESFRDDNMISTGLPARWLGKCEFPEPDTPSCNKKLIGARNFAIEDDSPRDSVGHGTHTASTAAGSEVTNANFSGYASGSARGVAPRARLAVYKVCSINGCRGSAILAGMDAAIHEGVDVLSISIGGTDIPSNYSYADDLISRAAFTAMERGIFVSCSAGNNGSAQGSVVNVAPWMVTVGAGTIDRIFPAFATLGNGVEYTGASMYVGHLKNINDSLGLVYVRSCDRNSTIIAHLARKVVICDEGKNTLQEKVAVVWAGFGVGMILVRDRQNIVGQILKSENNILPLLAVGRKVGNLLKRYAQKMGSNATVNLTFGATEVNVKPSPVVAEFSSRGPNRATLQILKPDIIGPGVNILGAWTWPAFKIDSGTSMSCPHICGIAALLKAAHPEWSPSAIKSALMTTAYTLDNTNSSIRDAADNSKATPLSYGAGHVNPKKAFSPGLVYDATSEDYISFLCSINYTKEAIQSITGRTNTTCDGAFKDPGQLNYPSFSVVFGTSTSVVSYTRELTNVEDVASTYQVSVEDPENVIVNVHPSELVFQKAGDKQRYIITFTSKNATDYLLQYAFGSVNWTNAKTQVKSPISVHWV